AHIFYRRFVIPVIHVVVSALRVVTPRGALRPYRVHLLVWIFDGLDAVKFGRDKRRSLRRERPASAGLLFARDIIVGRFQLVVSRHDFFLSRIQRLTRVAPLLGYADLGVAHHLG